MIIGPFWDQWTEIRMADGRFVRTKDLQAGDVLWGGYTVLVVVKAVVMNLVPIVRLSWGGALTTPWHPVRQRDTKDDWQFSEEIHGATKKNELVEYYYNLVLDKGHIVQFTGGWDACTLGHGFDGNDVIRHPYFGSAALIEDLKKMRGWTNGLIILNSGDFIRDETTGLVCRLRVPV